MTSLRGPRFACALGLATALALLSLGCGSSTAFTPTGPSQPVQTAVAVTGRVTDRIADGPLSRATLTLQAAGTPIVANVENGNFNLPAVPVGTYRLEIAAAGYVTHTTASMTIDRDVSLDFSLIPWGGQRFGATYDERFSQFFHQIARVSSSPPESLRRWTMAPEQIYVVADGIPAPGLDLLLSAVNTVNSETVPAAFCGLVNALPIVTGPDRSGPSNGQILIRPAMSGGAGGTLGGPRSGTVAISIFATAWDRLFTEQELVGILAHEVFHVAGAYHVCGGNTGTNPYGFSPQNCLFPNSLMANLGPLVPTLSPEDRLAACLMYHPHTVRGNLAPDQNPTYR